MFSLIIFFVMVLLLSLLLLLAMATLSKKSIQDREKLSPFECGFTPKTLPRIPFSLRFFLVALIFLVFDVELVLIFPFLTSHTISTSIEALIVLIIFLIILTLGLYYENNQGMIMWAN